ncbi:MAG: MFS transporter [[Ruminococcus] gnavus]|nr:MFS transporter [Mediterraneibacter gnavus]
MKKEVTRAVILKLCLPQFAVGLFTTMLNNYLIYFYQPSKQSGLPNLIPQGVVVLGVFTVIGFIKAIGHVIDAVTDPLIAARSDRSLHKDGRRIPLMRWSAVPFGICAFLIFCVPFSEVGLGNAIWIAVFMWGYYLFYTLYMIPHTALIPEMIQEGEMRVNAYTWSSFFFVTGSAVGYATPALVSVWKNVGLSAVTSWRITFFFFTVMGIVLLLIPACTIREKEYVSSVIPGISLKDSLKHAFSNPHFRLVTLGQLLENTGMAFFQACIMYYVTTLMGLPETSSVLILAISIAGSLLLYPLINRWAKQKGKRSPMICGCLVFSIAEGILCFSDGLTGNKMLMACLFALFVSFPFAVLNVLPASMMADIIQYDTLISGINQEGIFGAARSFIVKMGNSFAIMIVPSLTVLGAASGENVGVLGLKCTAIAGAIFCLAAVVVFAKYREKDVLSYIRKRES